VEKEERKGRGEEEKKERGTKRTPLTQIPGCAPEYIVRVLSHRMLPTFRVYAAFRLLLCLLHMPRLHAVKLLPVSHVDERTIVYKSTRPSKIHVHRRTYASVDNPGCVLTMR